MSRRIGLLLALALMGGLDASLGAQSSARETDSLLTTVRVLDSIMLARSRSMDSVRERLVRSLPPVDIRHGAIHVRTDAALAPRVREAVETVDRLVTAPGGNVFTARAAAHVTTITRDSVRSMFGMVPVIVINADTVRRWSSFGQQHVPASASAPEIASGLAAVVAQFAMQGVDSAVAAWVMMGRAPLRPSTPAEKVDAYTELATTESAVLRRCRARDYAACLDALGVDSVPGTRLARWYSPEDYRSVVRTVAPASDDSVAVASWIGCRQAHDDAGCRIAAHALPDGRVPLPLSVSARFTFFRAALDAGGPGAFDRLVDTPGTVRVRLTAAANEPLERTAERWLRGVEQSRPDRMRLSPLLIVASLGWTGAILSLALARRPSWA